MISCSFSSLTRNVALGRSSTTKPGNSRNSSFDIGAFHCRSSVLYERQPSVAGTVRVSRRAAALWVQDCNYARCEQRARIDRGRGEVSPVAILRRTLYDFTKKRQSLCLKRFCSFRVLGLPQQIEAAHA